jgi:phosphatidylglycerol---prolipoprotein diacylglyceryl transferase
MPTGFQLGPLYVRFYGIILMLGAVAAAILAEREARRRGQSGDLVWDGLIWVLIGGIIGARIWHIFTPPPSMVDAGITVSYYLTHPLDMLAIWRGGLGIPGAVIGGIAALYLFCRRRKLDFPMWLDIAAPALALGQAIGRWGNFINQELYGAPTSLPWKIFIEPQYRLPGYQDQAYYHPLFLYESLGSFAIVILLLWLARRKAEWVKTGDIFLVYLISYPTLRFLLEFIRLDSAQVASLNANQTFMGVVAIAAAVTLVLRHRTPGVAPEQEQEQDLAQDQDQDIQ